MLGPFVVAKKMLPETGLWCGCKKEFKNGCTKQLGIRVYLENKSIEKSESKCPRVVASRPKGSCASI